MKNKEVDITKLIKVGDKVRYKGKIIEVMRFSKIDKKHCLQDTDQVYKNDKLFAEKINGTWKLVEPK